MHLNLEIFSFKLTKSLLDSAFPLEKTGQFDSYNSTNAWNYFHINSVDKNDDGDYLISARNYAAIFKISGKTGEVIWQLGGKGGSSFIVPDDVQFAFQHDARFLHMSEDGDTEIISFFDNAAHTAPGRSISPFSRGRIVRLRHSTSTVEEIKTFPAPDGLSTRSQGNVQVLPNGNVFVNWGQAGAVTEFDHNGKVLFHAYLDSQPYGKNVQSYRGFRFNWTGYASEEPAVVALHTPERKAKLSVYVSWNGDTRTKLWKVYSQSQTGQEFKKTLVGEAERTSFETKIIVDEPEAGLEKSSIIAEALDEDGRVIGTSKAVSSIADYSSDAHQQATWFQAQVEL